MTNANHFQDSPIMAFDVFISYSTRNKLIADAMKQYLQSKGIRCWKAPDDIVHGESWAKAIQRAIKESRIMVLIWTRESMSSSQVVNELTLADRARKLIIPFRTEEIEPEDEFEYYLAKTHWLDAFGSDNDIDFELLSQRVLRNLSGEEAPAGHARVIENLNLKQRSLLHAESRSPSPAESQEYPGTGSAKSNRLLEEYLDGWFTDQQLSQAIASISYYNPLTEIEAIREEIGDDSMAQYGNAYCDPKAALLFEQALGGKRIVIGAANESIIVLSQENARVYPLRSLTITVKDYDAYTAAIVLNGDEWKFCIYRPEILEYASNAVNLLASYAFAMNAKTEAKNSNYEAARTLALSSAQGVDKLCDSVDLSESLILSSCLVLNSLGDRESARTFLEKYIGSRDDVEVSLIRWRTLGAFLSHNIVQLYCEIFGYQDLMHQPEDSDCHHDEKNGIDNARNIQDAQECQEIIEEINDSIRCARADQGFLWDGGRGLEEEEIGIVLRSGRINELEAVWMQMIAARESFLPSGDYLIARGMSMLSSIMLAQGRHVESLEYAMKALDLRLDAGEGASSFATNRERLNVARILFLIDKVDQACELLAQIVECYAKTDGSNEMQWRSLAADAISLRKELESQ
jgi:hypothetical protein